MINPIDGSSLYYSLLWTPAPAKESFLNRLTLIQALSSSLDDVQEPTVAEKKIHWWHEELERLAKSTPRHPACEANQNQLGGNQLAIRHCLSILSSAASTRYTQSQTIEEANELLLTSYKARLSLLSDALHYPNRDMLTNPLIQSDSLALAFAIHENLYRLPQLLNRGFAVFSDETYDRHSITPTDFAKSGSKPLLQEALSIAQTNFQTAFLNSKVRATYQTDSPNPLWRLAKLRAAQLQLWRRKETRLTQERSTLTPVKKLYIAWRNKRA